MTNWKKLMNKNYLGSWDVEEGKDLILTIKGARQEEVQNPSGKKEKCLIVDFIEPDFKPMIINSTNGSNIEKATGTPYIEQWAGHKIAIFTAKVSAFGEIVDALRIRPTAPIEQAPAVKHYCESCGKEIQPFGDMDAEAFATYTKKKLGKELCLECSKKLAKEKEAKK